MEKIYTRLLNHFPNLTRTACFLVVSLFSYTLSYAEGTAELTPTLASDNQGVLQLWDNNDPARNSFTYGAPSTKRLNFTICNPEEVYFGMSFDAGDLGGTSTLWYRIIAPDSTVAFPVTGTGWQQVTNTGAGSIGSWAQAVAGPNNIAGGAGGYVALHFTPTMAGDFWIEFYRKSNAGAPTVGNPALAFGKIPAPTAANITSQQRTKVRLRYFDLTVTDAPNGNRIRGRLFSQTWDINVNGANNPFIATMYVYSDDGIVTGLNFNRIRPFGFTIACNPTGVASSGNTAVDRRSTNTNSTYAQYKIFLHDPDNNCYGTGIFGDILNKNNITVTGCDVNNRCINVVVDKAGGAELLLNFNGVAGYQFGSSDVLIKVVLNVGSNCIPWNSRDGLGNLVTPGSNLDMRLDYFNGITHLPLFDVENHPYGFIVSLVRPAGPPPLLFWDDTGIGGGTSNLSGCTTGVPTATTGCHGFGTVTSGAMPPSSNPTNGDWGNNRTINTWWYANYINVNANYNVPGSISVDANTNVVGTGASNDISSCTNAGPISLSGGVTGATGGTWTVKPGVTGVFANPVSLTTTFTPSAVDLAKPFIYIYLTSTGNGACPAVKDSMRITFVGGPTVGAGPPQSACENNSTLTLAGSFTVATGIQWSGGGGTFVPNSTTTNATYTPSAAELTAGSVTLTITTTGNGLCPAATASVTHTYFKAPTVSAGSPVTVCANNPVAALVGTATNQTGVAWSGGGGSFSTPGSTSTTYNPSAIEKTGGPKTVILTLTASKVGCNSVTSNVNVRINPSPTVNAGVDTTICRNDSFNLVGVVTQATGGTWTGGSGKFTPNANSLTANYKPSAAELAGSSVTLTLTTTGNGTCLAVTDQMRISFIAAPTIVITGPSAVCDNNPVINLSNTRTGAPGQSWLGSGGSFIPNTTASTVSYTPSAAEIALGFTGIVARTTGGKCPPITDTLIVTFNPAPTIDAGAPISICENNPTGALTGSVTGVASSAVTWSSPTGGFFSASTNVNTNYTATAADITNGSVLLTVTANKATCNPVSDQVLVTITRQPTVSAGPSRTVCANNATATFNGAFTGSTGVLWTTGGDGTFGTPTAATTTYTAGPNDITAGTVTLTITTTGNGNCLPLTATTTMTITLPPVVSAGTYSVCANNAATQLNGTVSVPATGGRWVGGAGTFSPSRNVLNPIYTPTPAEATAGSLSLTLQSTGNGNCNAVTANGTITFTPAPTLTPATPVNVCADAPRATISTTRTLATGVLWSGGSGTIANPTSLSTTYNPSLSEITAGTATLTVTTTGNGTCSPVSANVIVNIAPAPTVNAGSNQVVCGTVATVSNLSGTITGATGGTWTKVTGTGTFGNANSVSTTYTPSNQDVINGSVTLRLTSTGNGLCQPVSNTMTISYTPVPSINAGVNQIVCSTELPINLSASGSPAVWSPSGGSFGNANSLITTYTPSAGEISAGTVTLTIRTIASGACPVKTSQLTVTIPAGPIVNVGAPTQTMCGSLTSFQLNGVITNATGGIWTTNGSGSFLPNANALNATYQPSALDRSNGGVNLTLTSTGNGLCQQVSRTLALTITPPITVSAGPNQTLCADVSGIPLHGTMANATGVLWSITSGSGSITSSTSLVTTYTPSAGDITAGTVSFLLTSTGNGGCPAVTSPVTFTLTPAPTLNAGANQTICGDSAFVQLNASITIATGIVWTSNGTGTFTPNNVALNARYIPSAADITAGSVILTATTTGNGTCNPVVRNITITITPIVTLNPGTNQTTCENNSTVNLAAVITTATAVNWTTSGTGTFASQTSPATTYNPSAADISAGLVTLTVRTTGNGTCKVKTAQVQVTIKPAPIVNAGLPQTVCSNATSVAITGSVLHASGGTWTTSGTGTFANANALITNYFPTSADTTAGSVTLTLTSTGNGTCNPVSRALVITFKKLPIVVAGPNQTICADSAFVQLSGKIANAGGGVWTKSGTGTFFPSTIDLNAVYSPTAADKTAKTVTLTLTSTSNGECPAVSSSLTVTITDAPKVFVSPDQIVCANNALTSVSGTSNGISSGIRWTTSGTGTFTSTTSLTPTYTPSALDKASGLVVLAMSTTGNGTCKPAQGFITLTITPAPTLTAGFDKSICADSLGVLLNQAAKTVATGVQWSTNGSGVFGPNNTTIQPTYFPSSADITTGSVRLIAITTGNGNCLPVTDTINIAITPAPTVNAGTDISICADTNAVKLAGTSTVAGGIKWTTSGTGVFTPSSTINNAEYVPSAADTTAKNVTLTLTTTNNGTCKAVSSNVNISIAPKPVVDAGVARTVCADVDQLLMGGVIANATGGSWSTNGTGTFSPSSGTLSPNYTPSASDLSVGTVVLTLVSTGNGFCKPVSDNVTIKFNPVATISAGNDLQVCNSVTSVSLNGSSTNTSNVVWSILSGSGTITSPTSLSAVYNIANPADLTAGSVVLRITGSALSGCSNVSNDVTITFVAAPPIEAGPSKTVCDTDLPIKLEGTGSTAQWSGYAGTFNPNDQTLNALYTPSPGEISSGTVTLTLTTTNNGVCTAAVDNVTYTIIPGPRVDAGTISPVCSNASSVSLTGTSNGISSTGVQWSTAGSGIFAGGNTLTPTYTPSSSDKNGGQVVLTITSTGNNAACKAAKDTVYLNISPAPTIAVGSNQIVCGDAATVDVSSSFTNATGVQWSNASSSGSFVNAILAQTKYNVSVPADTTAGVITVNVQTTGQNVGCLPATAQMTISFTKLPQVNAGTPITVCTDTTSVPLNGKIGVATGGIWSSTTGGTFSPNASQLNAKYIPSAADLAAGTATVRLTSTGNGNCNAYSNNVVITLNPKPIIAGSVPKDSVCTGNTILATATVTNTTSLLWKTTGTGTFSTTSGFPTVATVYTPSQEDQDNGGVIIYATTVGSNPCKEIEKYFSITILKSPASLVNAGFDQIACADAGFFPLNGTVGGLTGSGIWTSATGRGDFYPDATDLNPVFVPDQADIDAGGLTITLTSTNNGICSASKDDMLLTITPTPLITTGTPFPPLCADTAFIQLNPTITNALGGEWSTTGTGIFSPSITALNAVYVPSDDDRKKGLIALTLTTTGNGTCNAYSDFLNINLTPMPTLSIGQDKTICADQLVDLNADVTVATSVDWTASGTGIITSPNASLSTKYILSISDTINKVFNVFATTVGQGLCKPVSDTLKVTVKPRPVVFASGDQLICADVDVVTVSSIIDNAGGVDWSTNGSGSFSPNSSANPLTYNISNADKTKGSVRLYATSTNSGICSPRIDSVDVLMTPIPIVSAGAPIICDTLAGANLTGTITSLMTGGATWTSSSNAGIFSINNSTLTPVYVPGRADIEAGSVTLTLTASGYGTCQPVSSFATLLIEPLPIAHAGDDQISCLGASVTVSANDRQAGVNYSWKDGTGAVVAPPNSPSHTFIVAGNAQRILVAENYKGCIVTDTVNISTFTLPQFNLKPDPACYQENLLIQANPSPSPTVAGLYQWFNNGVIMTNEVKPFLVVPDTGTYTIVYSYNNCSATGEREVDPAPTIVTADIVACGNGVLTASVVPSNATINWSLNGVDVGTGSSLPIIPVVNDTIKYDIKVTDPATGCPNADSVYVIGIPNPTMVSLDSTSCTGLTVRLTARPTNIPNLDQFLDLKFDWRKDAGAIFSADSTVIINSAGVYKGAVSIGQCKDTSTNTIGYSAYPTSTLLNEYVYCPDQAPRHIILDAGSQANTKYVWSNGFTGPLNTVSPKVDTIYTVTITNQYFCSINDQTIIYAICAPNIEVPTAFTPDIAGSGDQLFRGFGKYEVNYKLMVFNRWGEVIFISNDKMMGWDGKYLGQDAPSGVYPWIVTYEGRAQFKGPYKKTGQVTLIR